LARWHFACNHAEPDESLPRLFPGHGLHSTRWWRFWEYVRRGRFIAAARRDGGARCDEGGRWGGDYVNFL
jgi:hypothetical protein